MSLTPLPLPLPLPLSLHSPPTSPLTPLHSAAHLFSPQLQRRKEEALESKERQKREYKPKESSSAKDNGKGKDKTVDPFRTIFVARLVGALSLSLVALGGLTHLCPILHLLLFTSITNTITITTTTMRRYSNTVPTRQR